MFTSTINVKLLTFQCRVKCSYSFEQSIKKRTKGNWMTENSKDELEFSGNLKGFCCSSYLTNCVQTHRSWTGEFAVFYCQPFNCDLWRIIIVEEDGKEQSCSRIENC